MRLGCGCLLLAVLLVGLAGLLGVGVFNVLADPGIARPHTTAADAQHAQEKLYAIASQSAPRGRPVSLSAAEVNAFLARNLVDTADAALHDLRVDLSEPGRVRVAGRTSLAALLSEPPLAAVGGLLPVSWLRRPVWVTLSATPRLETTETRRRYLRLAVEMVRIGRQRVPAVLAKLLLDPAAWRLLRWPVPETVDDVRIENGRVLVRVAS